MERISDENRICEKIVSGFQEEEEFTGTALKTIEILRTTVDVKPADEILEIGCSVGRIGKELALLRRFLSGSNRII